MAFSKSYWILWFGFLVSSVGDWLLKIALPLVIYARTGSSFQMAATFGLSFVPWLLFSLLGGVIADRQNKKQVLIIGNLLAGLFLLGIVFVTSEAFFSLPAMYGLVFLFSSIEPLIHPTFQSLLPDTVGEQVLVPANAQFQLIDNVVTLMGPLVGGTLALLVNPAFAIAATIRLLAGLGAKFTALGAQK